MLRRGLAPAGVFAVAWLLFALADPHFVAAEDGPGLTGEALRKALGRRVSITWSSISRRQALESLSRSQHLAILLDRRIDPDQKIELAVDQAPLQDALRRIAEQVGGAVTFVGPVAYIGPANTAGNLRALAAKRAAEAARLPLPKRARWTRGAAWKWDDLATPRELLESLAKEEDLQIDGLEQVPHDLWSAADLPALRLSDRLTLVLAQFDLTYEQAGDAASIRIVPANFKQRGL